MPDVEDTTIHQAISAGWYLSYMDDEADPELRYFELVSPNLQFTGDVECEEYDAWRHLPTDWRDAEKYGSDIEE